MSGAEWFLVLYGGALAGAILGGIISLPALVPPVRLACRRDTRKRAALVAACGLVALAVGFGLITRALAEGAYLVYSSQIDTVRGQLAEGSLEQDLVEQWDSEREGVVTELWFRQMMPPGGAACCLAGRPDVCRLVLSLRLGGGSPWGLNALTLCLSLVSALASACLAGLFTRGGQKAGLT